MIRTILLAFSVLGVSFAFSQAQQGRLQPGDKLPEFTVITEDSMLISRNDFLGKFVLLDFWDVSCKSCIEAMPKLEMIKAKLKDSLSIFLITHNTKPDVDKLFSRIKIQRPALQMINNDELFHTWFPNQTRPHYVIISPRGEVRAITGSSAITSQSMQALVRGESQYFPYKLELGNFNAFTSLLSEGNGRMLPLLRTYSCFLSRIIGYNGGVKAMYSDTNRNLRGLRLINCSISRLYQLAHNGNFFGELTEPQRLVVETKDSVRFREPGNKEFFDSWEDQNVFSYESAVPAEDSTDLFKKLAWDLDINFPYSAQIETRIVNCLILKRKDQREWKRVESETGGESQEHNYWQMKTGRISFTLLPFLYSVLDRFLIDETGINYPINLTLKFQTKNSRDVIKALDDAGIVISEEARQQKMLVIRDKRI